MKWIMFIDTNRDEANAHAAHLRDRGIYKTVRIHYRRVKADNCKADIFAIVVEDRGNFPEN